MKWIEATGFATVDEAVTEIVLAGGPTVGFTVPGPRSPLILPIMSAATPGRFPGKPPLPPAGGTIVIGKGSCPFTTTARLLCCVVVILSRSAAVSVRSALVL